VFGLFGCLVCLGVWFVWVFVRIGRAILGIW
jgi:hypothetical protein